MKKNLSSLLIGLLASFVVLFLKDYIPETQNRIVIEIILLVLLYGLFLLFKWLLKAK